MKENSKQIFKFVLALIVVAAVIIIGKFAIEGATR